MSLFKYGNLEAEIDFTDADFLDRIDEAKQNLEEDMKGIPKTGKAADIVRAQCQCFCLTLGGLIIYMKFF